jgi:hypothetical protein
LTIGDHHGGAWIVERAITPLRQMCPAQLHQLAIDVDHDGLRHRRMT